MIGRLVSFALKQRFMIVAASIALMVYGAIAFRNLPIDAYPDLAPPHVELITQWPGHAAEEIERLVTIPVEIEMNGIPRLESLRSISLYGLSFIEMNFEYGADPYFVREQAFERVANVTLPAGLTPSISPLFSPSGLIYRYVVQSPDRSPQDLKTIETWLLERHYKSIPGVADDSGFGATDMQYQVLPDPTKLVRLRRERAATPATAFQQQREFGRRLLFAGRPVLQHSRPGTRPGYGRYPQHHRRGKEGHASLCARFGPSTNLARGPLWGSSASRSRTKPSRASF